LSSSHIDTNISNISVRLTISLARRYLEHARRLREYLAKEAIPTLEDLEKELEEGFPEVIICE
jgi:hypothetical protein